jgi:HAMP domain-containing protein
MKLMAKFNLILLVLFGTGALVTSQIAFSFLINNARRQVLQEAELMMASAKAVRDYTSSNLAPLLSHTFQTCSPDRAELDKAELDKAAADKAGLDNAAADGLKSTTSFHAETVPAFAATTTFNQLRQHYPDYGYKEATLNPTNLEHRASDWEADVIGEMRDHPDQTKVVGERDSATGRSLYLATPIQAVQSCMECHSVASAAPAAMIASYGSANGFGWKPGEIVAAQIVSVPMSVPVAIAKQAYHHLLLYLSATLIVTIVALDAGVYWLVIRPLRLVSETADRVSTGEKDVPPLPVKGKDEIANVTSSFNRMQVSLAKALKMLES